METTKKIIWTNNIDIANWAEDIKEWYPDEDLTESEMWNIAYENNMDNLEAEKANLNKELGTSLVMIADLGLWNGRRRGWKHINGTNLNDIFQGTCGDFVEWYVEDGDIKCDDIHHDGTNHYTYRAIKEDISEWEFDEMMYEGKDIDELTVKLGNYVSEIYGWN